MLLIIGCVIITCGLAVTYLPKWRVKEKELDVLIPDNNLGNTTLASSHVQLTDTTESLEKTVLAALKDMGLAEEDKDLALEALKSIGRENYDPKIYRRVLEQTTARIASGA